MKLETYDFNSMGCELAGQASRGKNWPVVYLIHNQQEMYVGETNSFQNRFRQHLDNPERASLTTISFIDDEEFNKSAILDIEQGLIRLCGADGKFVLQNKNAGQSGMHNYFQREKYEKKIPEIWEELSKAKLTSHAYDELVNSNLFKYSPYTTPTEEQNDVCYSVIKQILESLQNGKSGTSIVYGSAGTGKTIVAINLVYTLTNILLMNVDDDIDESDKWQKLIKEWKTYVRASGLPKIAFVVPMQSLNATLSDVFYDVGGKQMQEIVISPYRIAKEKYDIVIVDESHRLKKRKSLAGGFEFKMFDECCESLGLDPKTSNQLEWIVQQSRHRVLFYDPSQSIKPADINPAEYNNVIQGTFIQRNTLLSQMRCLGGSDYIDYIKSIFNLENIPKKVFGDYDIKVFDDVDQMVQAIKAKDREIGLCRNLAGYAWKWVTKGQTAQQIVAGNLFDIVIGSYRYYWNTTDKNWILSPNAVNEIGCVHTSQGYDLNIVGLIFGNEIDWDERRNCFIINEKEFYDTKVKMDSPAFQIQQHIINAYKVMITRGIKGCYMYACNPGMQKFLKKWF